MTFIQTVMVWEALLNGSFSRENTLPQGSRAIPTHASGDGGGAGAGRGNPRGQTRQALGIPRGGPCCLPALALSFVIAGVAG
jgi:hypothetical protein